MNKKNNSGLKIICLNRKASFNYFFEDLLEAGIALKGSEIKSIRDGKINIADSYAVEKNGELIKKISPFLSTAYESAILAFPSRKDFTSEPFKAIPASKSSKKK